MKDRIKPGEGVTGRKPYREQESEYTDKVRTVTNTEVEALVVTKHSERLKPWKQKDYQDMEYKHPVNDKTVPPLVNRPTLSKGFNWPPIGEGCTSPLTIWPAPVWIRCGESIQFGVFNEPGILPPFVFFLVSGVGSISADGLYTAPVCDPTYCNGSAIQETVVIAVLDACRVVSGNFVTSSFFVRGDRASAKEIYLSCDSCSSPVSDGDVVVVNDGIPPFEFSISKATISNAGVITNTAGECGIARVEVVDSDCNFGVLDVRMPVGVWFHHHKVAFCPTWVCGVCFIDPGTGHTLCYAGGWKVDTAWGSGADGGGCTHCDDDVQDRCGNAHADWIACEDWYKWVCP